MSVLMPRLTRESRRILLFYVIALLWWSVSVTATASAVWTHLIPAEDFLHFLIIWLLLVGVGGFLLGVAYRVIGGRKCLVGPDHFTVGWLLPPLFLAALSLTLWLANLLWFFFQ
jgi:hypothetical protein